MLGFVKTPVPRPLCTESGIAGLPSTFALRHTQGAIVVLAPDQDPHEPSWRCVARLPLPCASFGEVIELKSPRPHRG